MNATVQRGVAAAAPLAHVDRVEQVASAATVDGRLPAEVADQIVRLVRSAAAIADRSCSLGTGTSHAIATLQWIVRSVGRATERYLRLPDDYAACRPIRDADTSFDVLQDHIGVLADYLATIGEAVSAADAAALLALADDARARFGDAGYEPDRPVNLAPAPANCARRHPTGTGRRAAATVAVIAGLVVAIGGTHAACSRDDRPASVTYDVRGQ